MHDSSSEHNTLHFKTLFQISSVLAMTRNPLPNCWSNFSFSMSLTIYLYIPGEVAAKLEWPVYIKSCKPLNVFICFIKGSRFAVVNLMDASIHTIALWLLSASYKIWCRLHVRELFQIEHSFMHPCFVNKRQLYVSIITLLRPWLWRLPMKSFELSYTKTDCKSSHTNNVRALKA